MSKQTSLHNPVLLSEIVEMVRGLNQPPTWGLDATFGRGGHTSALLAQFHKLKMMAKIAAYYDLLQHLPLKCFCKPKIEPISQLQSAIVAGTVFRHFWKNSFQEN